MSAAAVAGGVLLAVFALGYLRPGRYGVAALALVAGNLLAAFFAADLADEYREFGVSVSGLSWQNLVYSTLAILPMALIILFSQKLQSVLPRLIGSAFLAVLASAVLVPLFAKAADGASSVHAVSAFLAQYREQIIAGGVGLAVIDAILARPPKPPKHVKD